MSSSRSPSSGKDGAQARRQHQWAWGIILAIGFLVIGATNFFNSYGLWTVIILAILMVAHGIVAYRNHDVSTDTRGDGFYYMGLLFTFFSLVFAVYEFKDAVENVPASDIINRVLPLIGNFGIAVVTTVIGLAGRVVLTMAQDSPGDIQTTATQKLEAAINKVENIVSRGGQYMEILVGHLKRSADQLEKTTNDIAGSAERAESTAAALEQYSTRVVSVAQAFSASVDDLQTAVERGSKAISGLEESMTGTQARMRTLDEAVVGFGAALEGAAEMIAAVEVATGGANRKIADARDGAVRELEELGSRVSALGDEIAKARHEFAQMATTSADDARLASRSLREQLDSVGEPTKAFARKITGLEAEMKKTGEAVANLTSKVEEAGLYMTEATSGFRQVGGRAAEASEGLEEMKDAATRTRGDLEAVARAAQRMQNDLAGPGNEVAAQVSAAGDQAVKVASDLNRLTDQLAETQNELYGITRNSAIAARQLKRETSRRSRFFPWRRRKQE